MPKPAGALYCPACGAGPYFSIGELQAHIANSHPSSK